MTQSTDWQNGFAQGYEASIDALLLALAIAGTIAFGVALWYHFADRRRIRINKTGA